MAERLDEGDMSPDDNAAAMDRSRSKSDNALERTETGYRTLGKLKMRGKTDDLPQ